MQDGKSQVENRHINKERNKEIYTHTEAVVRENLPGTEEASPEGSPALTQQTKMALINCQKPVFYVPSLDNIQRNISQESSPFGKPQHFLLPLLIFQFFVVVVLEENRKRPHYYKKLITFFGGNFSVESVLLCRIF